MGHMSYAAGAGAAGLVLALAAAGCSGDDDGTAAPAPSAASPPATTTSTRSDSTSASTADIAAAPDLPAVVDVTEVGAQLLPGGDGDWAMAVRGDVWVAGLGPGWSPSTAPPAAGWRRSRPARSTSRWRSPGVTCSCARTTAG